MLHFGASESKAVGQVTSHGFPELLLLLLAHDLESIVVRLKFRIVTIDVVLVCSLSPRIVCSTAASASASASSTLEAISMLLRGDDWMKAHFTFMPRFAILSIYQLILNAK
jgi:hypothetical protein